MTTTTQQKNNISMAMTSEAKTNYWNITKDKNQTLCAMVIILITGPIKKGKGQALAIVPQVDTATKEALRYMVHTKQCRTYLPYTFPAVASTHLPTPRGWRVELALAQGAKSNWPMVATQHPAASGT